MKEWSNEGMDVKSNYPIHPSPLHPSTPFPTAAELVDWQPPALAQSG